VIRRADAICFATQQSLRTVPAPAGGVSLSDLPAAAGYLGSEARLVRKQASQLRALPRPAARRAALDAFIAAASRSAADQARLAAAAKRGDRSAAGRALGDLADVPVSRLATAYGLTQCTGSASTAS
jgi:hypothetical protein